MPKPCRPANSGPEDSPDLADLAHPSALPALRRESASGGRLRRAATYDAFGPRLTVTLVRPCPTLGRHARGCCGHAVHPRCLRQASAAAQHSSDRGVGAPFYPRPPTYFFRRAVPIESRRVSVPVFLSPGNWESSVFNVWVATILLQEQLQVPAELVQYAGEDLDYYHYDQLGPLVFSRPAFNWPAIERGSLNFSCAGYSSRPSTPAEECTHGMLEIWSSQEAAKQDHIHRRGIVEHGGILSGVARSGWFTSICAGP
ncbi:hypothetical protein OAO87_04815 [bacterium]|nr:hypothetical protein [bacterium]